MVEVYAETAAAAESDVLDKGPAEFDSVWFKAEVIKVTELVEAAADG